LKGLDIRLDLFLVCWLLKKEIPMPCNWCMKKIKNGKWLSPKEGGLLTDEEKKKVDALRRK